ncbi:protein ZINC INDUCED FACILITATOR-LIKE 1 [Sesamum angolense]|uniref:Protein ZINC INDUCED FACILITATOR-LIKE 1 n=1 Tax=Sesamum angolense TaxID=2727404 RepID=A0AAE1T518_9LAMI|nr:protein ZINC INDUCED FACILITATOR-LIKE 1 [Sesamum angolense]
MEDNAAAEPLIKKQGYHDNCEACKIQRFKESNTGIPFKLLFFVWVVTLAATRDFHIAKREEDISFYAGYVGSSFMFGRALTSLLWGMVADKYGRKPIIMIGTITVVIFNTLFGLSVNYWMAISTRFLLGSLCGILGPMRIFSLWAVSSRKLGGLSFSTSDVGEVLSITAPSIYLDREDAGSHLGFSYWSCYYNTIAIELSIYSQIIWSGSLIGAKFCFLIEECTLCLLVIQNRAVAQEQRGAANGISMSAMSLFKAIGPAAGGSLLSWAQRRQHAEFLPGVHMVFFMLNVVEFVGLVMTFKPFLALSPDDISDSEPDPESHRRGAVSCASVHLGEIRPGTLRGNHRHHTCNETFVIWGAKTVFRLENNAVKRGYSEVTIGADEVAVAASPSGTAHALVNIDAIRTTFFLGCQDSVMNHNSSTTDYNIWKNL